MRVIYIVGSPKKDMSTTAALLGAVSERLGKKNKNHEPIFLTTSELTPENTPEEAAKAAVLIKDADVVVIGFPLYVDSIPSHLLRFLETICQELAQEITEIDDLMGSGEESRQTAYAVINCGFYEPEHMEIAADMTALWCYSAGLDYRGAVLVGAGGTGPVIANGKGPGSRVGKAIKTLAKAIPEGASIGTIKTGPVFPRKFYISAAHKVWEKTAKKRGISKESLYDLTPPAQ
jgi:multimeric flavodoxin WrbA